MPGDIEVICGSVVSENHRSPASIETSARIYTSKGFQDD